MIVFILRNRDS